MHLHLEPATPADASFLELLYREVHAPEFAPLQLPPPALDQLLAMQYRAQSSGYATQFPHAHDHIIHLDHVPAGRLLLNRTPTELLLVDIALLTPFRNHGAGTRVLQQLIDEATQASLPLRLTVRFDNPALHLYQRLGFLPTGGDGLNLAMQWHPQTQPIPTPNPTEPIQPPAPVDQDYTAPYFRSILHQTCTAQHPSGPTVPLLLTAVDTLPGQASLSDSFVLTFTGPLTPLLPDQTLLLTPPTAQPMAIFLVPTGPEHGLMHYQAIFNRELPK